VGMAMPEMVLAFDAQIFAEFISSFGSISGRPAPPVLDISNIARSTATVKFHCEHDKEVVLYSLRYRLEDGDEHDDDEKETEWLELTLDNGTDRYMLSDLRESSRYELCGRYKLLSNGIWSESCDSVIFNTTSVGQLGLEWDPSRKNSRIELLGDNTKMKITSTPANTTIMAKQMLSADTMSTAECELTFGGIEAHGQGIHVMIGVVDGNAVGQVKMQGDCLGTLSGRPGEWGFYIHRTSFTKYHQGGSTNYDSKWRGSNGKDGDRVLLTFDFVKSTCTISYNGEIVGVLTESLPREVYIGVNPCYPMTMEITKFECITRM